MTLSLRLSAACLVLFLTHPPVLTAQETEETPNPRAELHQLYMDYLKAEGYVPSVDEDGDVTFRFEGGFYYIEVDETDPEYFCLVYPGFWPIESQLEAGQVLVALDFANRATKNTKIIKVGENVSGKAESFVSQPEDFEKVFRRSLSALKYGVNQFREKMQELRAATTTVAAGP